MGRCNISTVTTAMVVVAVMLMLSSPTKAQQSCAQDLVPCADYLNNTAKPSTECCTVINTTVATQLSCLCTLFFTPGILEPLGGNTTSALRIATACGVNTVDVDKCKSVIGQAPVESPPNTAGQPGSDDGSGSGRIAWVGFPALVIFWASVLLR